jgi:hypothetical protein
LVPKVVGLAAVPGPDAPGGDVIGEVVTDLFSGVSFALGFAAPEAGPFTPGGNGTPSFEPGKALSFGSVFGETLVCNVVAGVPF